MIEKFTIKDFKSYEEANLYIAPLSILIGANASGKSNMLEALRLFSLLSQGQRLSDLQYKINQEDDFFRGFIDHLPRFGKSHFSFGCSVKNNNDVFNCEVTIALRKVKGNYELHIENETCSKNEEWLYQLKKKSYDSFTGCTYEYNNKRTTGGHKPTLEVSDQQTLFTQLNFAFFPEKHRKIGDEILEATKLIQASVSKMQFLDPNPKLMHGFSHKSDKKLKETGQNISAVLYNLIKDDAGNTNEILQFIESLPEQKIENISHEETSRGEVLIQLHESFQSPSENMVDASLLSDGTLRVLAIVAALLSAGKGSLVIIEEIDNGIHPNRVKNLMERINELAKRRGLSVLITSHNPTLLNASPKETVDNVQFCYRNKQDGSSKITRIQEIKDYPELIAQDDLGNLLTRGLIDQYVKDETTEEEKVKKGLDWLKGFEDE
jgi:predicted ATPase